MDIFRNFANAQQREIERKRADYAAENKKLHEHLLKIVQDESPSPDDRTDLDWDYEPSGYQDVTNGEAGA